ncbi:MAG: hypothetical protein FJ190_06290 [Gammaproteobacteria bacterium]|nr:hypothetical protein [Gammaproteobacteria bacterium]
MSTDSKENVRATVQFAGDACIDPSFRGCCFYESDSTQAAVLLRQDGDIVLSEKNGTPLWLRRKQGSSVLDLVAVRPKPLATNEILREHFSTHSFSHLLPLLHFMREVAGQPETPAVPRQACIVIDDPSLYFTSYGFINFKKLAEHAKQHGYHVAIATIAIDAWKINSRVAAIFNDYPDNLSLIIHGNNHLWQELSADRSVSWLRAILAQALQRFKGCRLQNYAPILEAPYGTFVAEATEQISQLGYAAALCTPSQFIGLNRQSAFPAAFGSGSTDVFPDGLCTIPRLVMSEDWRLEIAIAAFLRQPIVLACHHQDFFEGMGLLAEFTAAINRLGPIHWCSLREIAKANYSLRKENTTLYITLGSRNVECRLPPDVNAVVIERPWVKQQERLILMDESGTNATIDILSGVATEPLTWKHKERSVLRIESPVLAAVHPDTVEPPARRLWPVVRKVLQEARDRLYPLLPVTLISYLQNRKTQRYESTAQSSRIAKGSYARP